MQGRLSSLPTSEIQLAPGFIHDLKQIAPKKKRFKLWYVIALAVLAFGAWVGLARFRQARAVAAATMTTTTVAAAVEVVPAVSSPVSTSTTLLMNNVAPTVSAPPVVTTPSAVPSASASAKPGKRHKSWYAPRP